MRAFCGFAKQDAKLCVHKHKRERRMGSKSRAIAVTVTTLNSHSSLPSCSAALSSEGSLFPGHSLSIPFDNGSCSADNVDKAGPFRKQ